MDDVEDVARAPRLDHADSSHKHLELEGDNGDKAESDIDHDEAADNEARVDAQDNVQSSKVESDARDYDGDDNNAALPTDGNRNRTYDVSEDRDAYVDGIVDDDTDTIESEEEMFCVSSLSFHLEYV